jgi:hypothetical protein
MPEMLTLTAEQIRQLDEIRKERRVRIKDALAASRQRLGHVKKVRQAVAASAEPMTVPDLVAATGLAAPDVLWCVMALKKYGVIGERSNDDGYYRYGLEETAADVPEDDD